jgi:adenosylcobinamide-GDP ribazoletransferase
VPPARPGGLGALVAGTVRHRDAVAVTAAVVVAAAVAGLLVGGVRPAVLAPVAVAAGLLAAAALLRHAVRRLGGVTGDVLGALVETSVTAALLVMSVA